MTRFDHRYLLDFTIEINLPHYEANRDFFMPEMAKFHCKVQGLATLDLVKYLKLLWNCLYFPKR